MSSSLKKAPDISRS